MSSQVSGYCVQYGVWPNCPNSCKFCLLKDKRFLSEDEQITVLDNIIKNIDHLDWEGKFSAGISLLGGEVYYVKSERVQDKFMELVDVIIDKILLVSKNPACKYSTVTNGLYNPAFLYRVIDRIVERVGIQKVDVNFSFDFKYRFTSEAAKRRVLDNVNAFHKRYDYKVCVQMILTQYVLDMWKAGKFDVLMWEQENIPGNILTFLYPHPIHIGVEPPDFRFKRADFLQFMQYLRTTTYDHFVNFVHSALNSERFKYTGLEERRRQKDEVKRILQVPILSDGKEIKADCGHSVLYRCYKDSDRCMLCDLLAIHGDI